MSTAILHSTQKAIQAYLEDQTYTHSFNIYKGMEHETVVDGEQPNIELPAVTVSTMRAVQDPPFCNNWVVDVVVAVRTNADDTTGSVHDTMADEVFSSLYSTGIAAALSGSTENYTVFLLVPGEQTFSLTDRSWVSQFEFTVHCCPAAIS